MDKSEILTSVTIQLIIGIIIQFIFCGIFLIIIQGYFDNKWKPLTAAEVLKKENFLNSKRDVYFEAIGLINRYLANDSWKGGGADNIDWEKYKSNSMPSSEEINACFAKLCIYTEDKQILMVYLDFFDKSRTDKPTTILLAEFVNLIRMDLGYDKGLLDPLKDEYKWLLIKQKS